MVPVAVGVKGHMKEREGTLRQFIVYRRCLSYQLPHPTQWKRRSLKISEPNRASEWMSNCNAYGFKCLYVFLTTVELICTGHRYSQPSEIGEYYQYVCGRLAAKEQNTVHGTTQSRSFLINSSTQTLIYQVNWSDDHSFFRSIVMYLECSVHPFTTNRWKACLGLLWQRHH